MRLFSIKFTPYESSIFNISSAFSLRLRFRLILYSIINVHRYRHGPSIAQLKIQHSEKSGFIYQVKLSFIAIIYQKTKIGENVKNSTVGVLYIVFQKVKNQTIGRFQKWSKIVNIQS